MEYLRTQLTSRRPSVSLAVIPQRQMVYRYYGVTREMHRMCLASQQHHTTAKKIVSTTPYAKPFCRLPKLKQRLSSRGAPVSPGRPFAMTALNDVETEATMTTTTSPDSEDTANTSTVIETSPPLQSDDEFEVWFLDELIRSSPQVHSLYPELFSQCATAVTHWRRRYRDDRSLWLRLFKADKVIKEVIESIPVISLVQDWMDRHNDVEEPITIIDLCSGKGYLSMLLSEILPPDRVTKCILVDKAWPMCHGKVMPHHVNWEHIYGNDNTQEGPRYYKTWPIPLVTSKVNLNKTQQITSMIQRFGTKEHGPVLILAVHLCGVLSIRAATLFQKLPTAQFLLLKPCCLPNIRLTRDVEDFEIGNYRFPALEVCARGKWTRKGGNGPSSSSSDGKWEGPARWKLQGKFDRWCFHLFTALNQGKDEEGPIPNAEDGMCCLPVTSTKQFDVPLQTNGGFQNTYLYAER